MAFASAKFSASGFSTNVFAVLAAAMALADEKYLAWR